MSIRFKILIPMVLISVLATSAILFSNVMQFSSFVDNYIEGELERAVLKTIDEIESLKAKSQIAALYCSKDDELISAMENGDQKAVLNRTMELFEQTNIESLSIVDADAIVLARGHSPESYGDSASHMPMVQASLSGESLLSAMRGITTNVSIRASVPLYNSEGRLLGALSTGDRLDTDKFVDKLKVFTGCEITVFLDDVRVATTLYDENGVRETDSLDVGYTEKALMTGNDVTRQIGSHGQEIMEKHIPIYDSNGEVVGVVSVGRYLNEKQRMITSFISTGFLITFVFVTISVLIILFVSRRIAAPLSHRIDQARYDELTEIFNRRTFEERFSSLIKTLSRLSGTVSVMMIDIDFFKNYNDTYGHIKGDDCLRAVAAVLTQTISRADDLVARYGGEEFVAVLPNTDEAGARIMAEKLLEGIHECAIPHESSKVSDYITISIGVTTGCVDQSSSGTDFIRQADFMLYESKRNGRNKYSFTPLK